MTTFTIRPVAIAHTPFPQKFGIPRQAGLVNLPARIELLPPYNQPDAVEGLEQVSHIWLQFVFHQHTGKTPALQVRPPRLGGNRKIGVFASRSSFRPNYLGQSVVQLVGIKQEQDKLFLDVCGIDVVDGTPIVDIKPYLPYADNIEQASNGIAGDKPQTVMEVSWQDNARQALLQLKPAAHELERQITELIAFDPRPAYKKGESDGCYAMALFDLDIVWRVNGHTAVVTGVRQAP